MKGGWVSNYQLSNIIYRFDLILPQGVKNMCKECGCDSDSECSCDCHNHDGHFERRFQTKTEQIAELEEYLSELKLEVQAVEEHLADLMK
jgi:hypothetical protein